MSFGSLAGAPTLVVNAANANTGRATHLQAGPILIDVRREKEEPATEGRAGRLLAVDLGLRTGLALFDRGGGLLSYNQMYLEDEAALMREAERILSGGGGQGQGGDEERVTHVVIEGRDAQLRAAWQEAAERTAEHTGIAPVVMEVWALRALPLSPPRPAPA